MATVENLELRVAQLKEQMNRLLAVPGITPAQRDAVTLGHQMTIEEYQGRIDALKAGQPDPLG